jgi:hypothetical protein
VPKHLSRIGYDEHLKRFFQAKKQYELLCKSLDRRPVPGKAIDVCVFCRRPAATLQPQPPAMIFQIHHDVYSGRCNAKEPCSFEIVIHKKPLTTIGARREILKEKIEDIEMQVVRMKYNTIFDYIDEKKATNRVETQLMPIYRGMMEERYLLDSMETSISHEGREARSSKIVLQKKLGQQIKQIKKSLEIKQNNASSSSSSSSSEGPGPGAAPSSSSSSSLFIDVARMVKEECLPRERMIRELRSSKATAAANEEIWRYPDDKTMISVESAIESKNNR